MTLALGALVVVLLFAIMRPHGWPEAVVAIPAAALLIALGNIILGPAMGWLLDRLGHDYRYTFAVGGVIALLGFGATLVVYRRFMALGGPRGYVAPE